MPSFQGTDDTPLIVSRRDFSGGINTRQVAFSLGENQVEDISNYDISVPGQIIKDKGSTLIEDLGDDAGTGLFGFQPSGSENVLVATHGQKLETWPASGTFTERKTDFTTSLQTGIVKAEEEGEGDVFLVGNGTDNWFRFEPDAYGTPQDLGATAGTGSDSPPKSNVGVYFRNRFWVLKGNLGYFSGPFPGDYSTAFDTVSNAFRFPVGIQKAIIPIRDLGLVFFGDDQVWGLNPSIVPDPTTDKPEKIVDIGCHAGKTCVQVADDIIYLATDGVRGLFRTQQDKVQSGQSFPLSYIMKEQFESINWTYAKNACAVYYDNKYIISLPVNSSTTNNQVWIYYPATQSWRIRDDWNVAAFAKMEVNGEERLYFIDSTDGSVYRAFYGTNDNDVAIDSSITCREEDFGDRSIYKVGGELEISALTIAEDYSFTVSVSVDGGNFVSLGTFSIQSGNAPVLPVDLPFLLGDNFVKFVKFHLEPIGRFRTLQVRIQDSADTDSDVIIYGYTIRTFAEEYENE